VRRAELIPAPVIPLPERFAVGTALSRSLSIWKRNVAFFFGIALFASLPTLLHQPEGLGRSGEWLRWGLVFVLSSICRSIAEGLMTYSVLEQLRGRKPPVAEALARGWSRAGPLLAATLFTSMLVVGAALAFVIPALILLVRWALLSPVVVAESGVDPRARSAELTAGHRWAIFGIMVLFLTAAGALELIARLTLGRLAGVVPKLITAIFPGALTFSVSAVLYSVIYYQLRSEKEGIDIEQLTSVFR
jgi:hypothetical protein